MSLSTPSTYVHVTQNLNRVLYPNPVCLLTTFDPSPQNNSPPFNVMTITWLTAINTKSQFIFSMNKKRFSANRMRANTLFGLQVPTLSWKDRILDIGAFSGELFGAGHKEGLDGEIWYAINEKGIVLETRSKAFESETTQSDSGMSQQKNFTKSELLSMPYTSVLKLFGRKSLKNRNHILYHLYNSKLDMLGLEITHHFSDTAYSKKKYKPYLNRMEPSKLPFIEGCCAHLVCGVLSIDADSEPDHLLVRAEILDGMLQEKYWKGGKIFHSNPDDPYLTFLGTQLFGKVVDVEASQEQDSIQTR